MILFAGGGSGGHIFPSLAIAERLTELRVDCRCHFLISTRPVDAQILASSKLDFSPLPVRSLPTRWWNPVGWPGFALGWFGSISQVRRMIRNTNVAAIVAMGGCVSAAAIMAASKVGLPVAMVNLDTPPGKANALMARRATKVFTVCSPPADGQHVGLPLRRCAIGRVEKPEARRTLGLNPERHVLLVVGGSQGAETLNRLMVQLVALPQPRLALAQWQVLHLVGTHGADPIRHAYAQAGIDATVRPFCDQMGMAWTAATVAISRAGAGSVAEARANGTPTVFMPYPHHADLHQGNNARELVNLGGAELVDDLIDPVANARQLAGPLMTLMTDARKRRSMTRAMYESLPEDGALVIAAWLAKHLPSTAR